jgi:hypothetical protein
METTAILQKGVSLEIVRAEYENNYRVAIEFNNGHHITVDFEPFLSKSRHPETRQRKEQSTGKTRAKNRKTEE